MIHSFFGSNSTLNDTRLHLEFGSGWDTGSLIQDAICQSFEGLSQSIDNRFGQLTKRFLKKRTSVTDEAVKRSKKKSFTCRKKGNQQQYDHCQQFLEKLEETLDYLDSGSFGQFSRSARLDACFKMSIHFLL